MDERMRAQLEKAADLIVRFLRSRDPNWAVWIQYAKDENRLTNLGWIIAMVTYMLDAGMYTAPLREEYLDLRLANPGEVALCERCGKPFEVKLLGQRRHLADDGGCPADEPVENQEPESA